MIVKELEFQTAKVFIDDSFIAKTEEEKKIQYEIFNQIGCEIICNSNK